MEDGSVAMGSPGFFLDLLSSALAVGLLGVIEKGKLPVRVSLNEYPYRLME